MALTLAIRGDRRQEYGAQVIEILEMLGGINKYKYDGLNDAHFYFINKNDGIIHHSYEGWMLITAYNTHTVESFYEKYPYRVGDKVKLYIGVVITIKSMHLSKNGDILYNGTRIEDDAVMVDIPVSMIQYKKEVGPMEDNATAPVLKGQDYGLTDHGYTIPEGYEFVEVRKDFCDREEIVLRKKEITYPKTYEECCKVLRISPEFLIKYSVDGNDTEGDAPLIKRFIKLKRCRDAYWKIAGEQMGLNEPWKPDWTSGKPVYCISVSVNAIGTGKWYTDNKILAFPTAEMRDAFYNNFQKLIDDCKELL
jgi:hypothetical protein